MSPEARRIAIAEVCGIKVEHNHAAPDSFAGVCYSPAAAEKRKSRWPGSAHVTTIPDYLNDLNAMHEAEKVLTPEQKSEYATILARYYRPDAPNSETAYAIAIGSPAAQRADAFLKTLGLLK